MANRRTAKIARKPKAVVEQRHYTTTTIDTETQTSKAISEIYGALATGRAQHDQARLMLSAVGKKLTLESLKIRAGLYKSERRNGFFLAAV